MIRLQKNNKYKNNIVYYNNIKFQSKKEASRYEQLKMMQKYNLIKDLELQKKFELQETFKDNQNKTHRAITYIVDFYYYDNENKYYVAEDVKGFATDVYKIKSKLFMYKYKNVIFKEIK